jgi:hypothetical protein
VHHTQCSGCSAAQRAAAPHHGRYNGAYSAYLVGALTNMRAALIAQQLPARLTVPFDFGVVRCRAALHTGRAASRGTQRCSVQRAVGGFCCCEGSFPVQKVQDAQRGTQQALHV